MSERFPSRPQEVKVPWLRRITDLPKAFRRGPTGLADLFVAMAELACANRRLAREPASALPLLGRGRIGGAAEVTSLDARQQAVVERVAHAIPVVALRVPWRADCLVQALAAQRWLAREGVPSRIALGTAVEEDGGFLAHAWLRAGDRIVTGGEVERYHEFLARNHAT